VERGLIEMANKVKQYCTANDSNKINDTIIPKGTKFNYNDERNCYELWYNNELVISITNPELFPQLFPEIVGSNPFEEMLRDMIACDFIFPHDEHDNRILKNIIEKIVEITCSYKDKFFTKEDMIEFAKGYMFECYSDLDEVDYEKSLDNYLSDKADQLNKTK
jgi:hypothetical protein